jgi:hypothetical protein
MKLQCVVCLFQKGKNTKAVTLVKGYAVCQEHLSYDEDFFRDWEAVQDPKKQTFNVTGVSGQ